MDMEKEKDYNEVVLSLEVDKLKAENCLTEDILNLLDRIIESDNDRKSRLGEKKAELEKKLEEVNKKLGVLEELEKTRAELEKDESSLLREEPILSEIERQRAAAKEALKDKDELLRIFDRLRAEGVEIISCVDGDEAGQRRDGAPRAGLREGTSRPERL